MAKFRFRCPHCRRTLTTPKGNRGQVFNCPSCDGEIELESSRGGGGGQQGSALPGEIRRKAVTALVVGILSVLACVGGLARGQVGDFKIDYRRAKAVFEQFEVDVGHLTLIEAHAAAQEAKLWYEAVTICVFLVGIGLAIYAVRSGRKALHLIERHDTGHANRGIATVATNIGWVTLGLNALLMIVTGL